MIKKDLLKFQTLHVAGPAEPDPYEPYCMGKTVDEEEEKKKKKENDDDDDYDTFLSQI